MSYPCQRCNKWNCICPTKQGGTLSAATQLGRAEQQLFGYHCAKAGDTIEGLVRGMGLAKSEWESLKTGGDVSYLSESDVSEIDKYFSEE